MKEGEIWVTKSKSRPPGSDSWTRICAGARASSLTADWTFLCPSPSVPESTQPVLDVSLLTCVGFMGFCVREVKRPPPRSRLCCSSVFYETLISGKIAPPTPFGNVSSLLQNVSAISVTMATRSIFIIRSDHEPVWRPTAGDLAHLPCVCLGAAQERASYRICFGWRWH